MEFITEILNFSLVDIIDIILVATLMYYAYKLLKGTVAINIFIGIILIYIVWRSTLFLKMGLLSSIIGGFMSVGIIALIVVFQPEIRKFLLMIGSTNLSKKGSFFEKIKFLKNQKLDRDSTNISALIRLPEDFMIHSDAKSFDYISKKSTTLEMVGSNIVT